MSGREASATRNATEAAADLRRALLAELERRRLDEPYALAEALGIMPITARGLLRREHWSVETSVWVAAKLSVPVDIDVSVGEAEDVAAS